MPEMEQTGQYNAFNAKPFVGYVSSGSSMEIVKDKGNLSCRQSKEATFVMGFIFLMTVACAFGIANSPDMARYIHDFQQADLWGKLGFGVIGLLIVWMLGAGLVFSVKKMLANTRFIVDGSGNLRFYEGWGNEPNKTVRWDQIDTLYLDTVTFQGKHRRHTSHLLILRLRNAEEIVLCADPEREKLDEFRQDIARRSHLQLQDNVVTH